MSIERELKCGGRCRVTYDTFNPRIGATEWKCAGCGEWVDEEDIVWAHEDGTLSTLSEHAKPWCEGCCPEEPEEE